MKSLLNVLKEEDRLRILITEIEKDNEATKDFKRLLQKQKIYKLFTF